MLGNKNLKKVLNALVQLLLSHLFWIKPWNTSGTLGASSAMFSEMVAGFGLLGSRLARLAGYPLQLKDFNSCQLETKI